MMVSSTATVFPGNADSSEAEKAYNRTIDVTRINEDEGPRRGPPEKSSMPEVESRIFGQLINDQLDSLAKPANGSSFMGLLSSLLNPKYPDPIDESKLYIVLRNLSKQLGKLPQDSLTSVALSVINVEQWSQLSPRVTDAYVQFLSILISGNPKWWPEIANRVVAQFPQAGLDLAPHHLVLRSIIQIVPTSSGALSGIFARNFPHKSSTTSEITSYVGNLLQIVEYSPEQLHAVWELIIQRLVELDVECEDPEEVIKRRLAEQSEGDSDSESDISSLDSDSDDDDGDENNKNDEDNDSETDNSTMASDDSATDVESDAEPDLGGDDTAFSLKRAADSDVSMSKRLRVDDIADGEQLTAVELEMAMAAEQDDMAAKVDAVLTLLLQTLKTKFSDEAVRSGTATPLFKTLLQIFKDIVLPTSRSQAVQFIWFFVTHAHRDLLASYLSQLLEIAMSSSATYDRRTRAMQYVASFVARAKGLSRQQIVFVVTFLADWVQRFIKERESEVDESLSMARFRVFYAAVQALFYIFVFRHSMLRVESDDEKGGRWEAGLDKLFQQAVNTRFNPLQYCQPEVVAMFARISQDEEVASCYSIIERNRWGRFRSPGPEGANANRTGASNGLFTNNRDYKLYDSFLPFQPLRLRKSKRFFADTYEKWSELDLSDSDTERERELEREYSDGEDSSSSSE